MDTSHHRTGFLLILVLVTIAFVWLLLPFYGAVFWAVILAIIFQPMQRAFERMLGPRRNLAAFLSVLACIVIAIIPMLVIATSLLTEGTQLVQIIQASEIDLPTLADRLRSVLPAWAEVWLDGIDFAALRNRLSSIIVQGSQLVAGQALNFGQDALRFFVSAGIMLYVLFFLFRDGQAVGANIRASLPLSDDYADRLITKFATVVRATVKGNVIIAAIQGTIGGVAFWLLGIEGALLWGVLMAFLSLLPAVGSALIWVPAAVWLLLSGSVLNGVILIAIGVGVIGLVDNLLRPRLVGMDTKLPDYVVLVSTVGGLSLFGINGFVIGPLIAALFIACWTLYRDAEAQGKIPGEGTAPPEVG